jgi:hypothetical protein
VERQLAVASSLADMMVATRRGNIKKNTWYQAKSANSSATMNWLHNGSTVTKDKECFAVEDRIHVTEGVLNFVSLLKLPGHGRFIKTNHKTDSWLVSPVLNGIVHC